MRYIPTIGLEIHIELKTKTKMFCGCRNDSEEKHSNINICPICLGHPGILPLINKQAVKSVLKLGHALNGKIAEISKFDRKNYFYPDLPKAYQISQFDLPFVLGGYLKIFSGKEERKIRINRVHLEEDAGRLSHGEKGESSFVDFNRAGVPLAELVTEPDIKSGLEAKIFAEELQRICRYLDISGAEMEKGEMRCEVNISLAKENDKELGTKVEIKNINSFKAVEQSVLCEIKRQGEILEKGERVVHETRGWDEKRGITFSQRSKEESHDYRYFPEPDLPTIRPGKEFDLDEIKREIPELPAEKRERFAKEFGLDFDHVFFLADSLERANFFENIISSFKEATKNKIKLAYNYFSSDLQGLMAENKINIKDLKFNPQDFSSLIDFVDGKKISSAAAKNVLGEMLKTGAKPDIIISEKNLFQVSDSKEIEKFISQAIEENQEAVGQYKSGKENALQFLVGKAMALSRGKADPRALLKELKAAIDK